jgi:insertion element IS1 protein InsB
MHRLTRSDVDVMISWVAEAEVDEMWSFVGKKRDQRWLWHAIDHWTGEVLVYVFGRCMDEVCLQLKALLEPYGIRRFHVDYWGTYKRHLELDVHHPGKRNTQRIERKHLALRMRIKRSARKTICFSKSIQMHDIVIGLCVNRYEFAGRERTHPRRRRADSLVGQLTLGCRSCSSFRKVAETEYDPAAVLPRRFEDVKAGMGNTGPVRE